MGWFLRFDRFTDSHVVFSQEKDESCGLASCKMVVFKMNKLRPGASAITTERKIEQIYRKYAPTHPGFDKEGSTTSCIVNTLNDLGMGNWASAVNVAASIPKLMLKLKYVNYDLVGAGVVVNSITRGYPVILGVDWLGKDRKYHRGHWVVVDTVNKLPFIDKYWASVCDPWDGDLHVTPFDLKHRFSYTAKEVTFSWSFDNAEHKYKRAGLGVANDIIFCQKAPGFFSGS
jgi:hypothetical protein